MVGKNVASMILLPTLCQLSRADNKDDYIEDDYIGAYNYIHYPASFYSDTSFNFKCCLTSTETIRLTRGGESRTATSTFTQLLSSEVLHS